MSESPRQFTLEECRELLHGTSSERLWPLEGAFLFHFQEMVDPLRVEKILPGIPTHLLRDGSQACRRRLSAFLLEKLDVKPFLHDFPKEDGSRMLLLPTEWYLSMGQRLELLSQEKRMRALIRKEDVLKFQEKYPGVYPQILRRTAFYTPWLEKLSRLPQDPGTGLRLLATCLQDLPDELLRRQRLRFPLPLETEGAFQPLPSEMWSRDENDLRMLFTVLKHEFPDEYTLCFS